MMKLFKRLKQYGTIYLVAFAMSWSTIVSAHLNSVHQPRVSQSSVQNKSDQQSTNSTVQSQQYAYSQQHDYSQDHDVDDEKTKHSHSAAHSVASSTDSAIHTFKLSNIDHKFIADSSEVCSERKIHVKAMQAESLLLQNHQSSAHCEMMDLNQNVPCNDCSKSLCYSSLTSLNFSTELSFDSPLKLLDPQVISIYQAQHLPGFQQDILRPPKI